MGQSARELPTIDARLAGCDVLGWVAHGLRRGRHGGTRLAAEGLRESRRRGKRLNVVKLDGDLFDDVYLKAFAVRVL